MFKRFLGGLLILAPVLSYAQAIDYSTKLRNQPMLSDASYLSFSAATTAAGIRMLAVSQTWTGLTNQTISTKLNFTGGKLRPASGQTLHISGPIIAPLVQIFDTSAGGTIIIDNNIDRYPQWFGAVMNGVTDDTSAWQAAVNSYSTTTGATATGRLIMTNSSAVGNILINGRGIEIAGCGAGGQSVSSATPRPCYITSTDAINGTAIFTIQNTQFLWMHGMRFYGNNAVHPNLAAIELKTAAGGAGANQFNHLSDIVIGPYNDGVGIAAFTDGIISDGLNGNDDSMLLENIVTYQNANCGINIANQQNVLWTITNFGSLFNGTAGICIAGGAQITNASFGGNPVDILFKRGADLSDTKPFLSIHKFSSEGSLRWISTDGSGHTFPVLYIEQSSFGYGNGVTPVNDGPCGPGSGVYAQCTKLIKLNNVPGTYSFKNVYVAGGASATGYQPIFDFTNSGSAYTVSMDWDAGGIPGAPMSGYFLLGSSSTGSNTNEHYRYAAVNGTSAEGWEYYGGYLLGNLTYFIPQGGIFMSPNHQAAVTTCTGSCTLDLTKGLTQSFILAGNVTSWTVQSAGGIDATAQINGMTRGGQDRISITMCASGGNFTASAPTYFGGGQTIGDWGFTTTINSGTCSQQMFEWTGTGAGRANSINAATAVRTGITP